MEKVIFILDRAHGVNVGGKSSPDGSFKEWEYSERVVNTLSNELKKLDIPFERTVKGPNEVGLSERVRRANRIAESAKKAFLISFHNNAAQKGIRATGIEVFTKREFTQDDIKLANVFSLNLKKDFREVRFRPYSSQRLFKTANYTVLSGNGEIKPNYSGILIEFLFMDNEYDLSLLKSEDVFNRYIDTLLYSCVQICEKNNYRNFVTPKNFAV